MNFTPDGDEFASLRIARHFDVHHDRMHPDHAKRTSTGVRPEKC